MDKVSDLTDDLGIVADLGSAVVPILFKTEPSRKPACGLCDPQQIGHGKTTRQRDEAYNNPLHVWQTNSEDAALKLFHDNAQRAEAIMRALAALFGFVLVPAAAADKLASGADARAILEEIADQSRAIRKAARVDARPRKAEDARMADLLDDDTVEQEGRRSERWVMDPGVAVLLAEVTAIIADRLGRRDTAEREMMWMLDGVPTSVILEAADRLGVTVRGGFWRMRRRA
ncbi:MAG TPA: hypothetical protein VGG77_11105 [Roseiarcus sp.]|jgi:hypothetical protein